MVDLLQERVEQRNHVASTVQTDAKASNSAFISAAVAMFSLYYSILLLFAGSSLLNDPDTFWHVRIGQWILGHAQVPTFDFFSYTAAGKPWISTEWLSEIFFALAFNLGSWRAVVILAALGCAAIIGLLCYYLLRNVRFSVAIGWTALTAVVVSHHFLARPHIFSYILVIVWTIKLLDAYDRNKFDLPLLFVFVPLMVLWANLHGSFTFGLFLFYVFAGLSFCESIFVRRDYKRSWRGLVVILVVTLSALATPYGIVAALETVKQVKLAYTNHHVNEMMPPDFQNAPFILWLFVALMAAISGLGIRLRGARLIIFCVTAAIALSYVRGIAMFFILAPIILARPLAACGSYFVPHFSKEHVPDDDKTFDPILRLLQRRMIAVPVASVALGALATASIWVRPAVSLPESRTPTAAIDFVRRANITGNVFNDYDFGGFLIFEGVPTFVDGRALLFGDAFLQKYNAAINLVDIDAAFDLLDEYKVNWIILRPFRPLAKALARSAAWDEVYSDKYAVVFTRKRP